MEVGRKKKGGEGGAGSSIRSERPPPPVEPKTAALVRVAAAIAAGETAELEARLGAARGAGVPLLWIEELLLQSLLVVGDRKSTRLNSSHSQISYAVFCLKKKKKNKEHIQQRRQHEK